MTSPTILADAPSRRKGPALPPVQSPAEGPVRAPGAAGLPTSALTAHRSLENYTNNCGSDASDSRSDQQNRPNQFCTVSADQEADPEAAQRLSRIAERRTWSYGLRAHRREISTSDRGRACGAVPVRPGGSVDVRGEQGGPVGYSGLLRCGSVWACPVCAPKIGAQRRAELEKLADSVERRGGSVAFVTMTLRHHRGQKLADLFDALVKRCWRAVQNDKASRAARKALGYEGFVRVVEVTHGGAGWHPHIHVLYVFERRVVQAQMDALADVEFRAWRSAAKTAGLGAPMRKFFDVKAVASAAAAKGAVTDYISKSAMSYELTHQVAKKGRTGADGTKGRSPWEILEDSQLHGRASDRRLWREYERATHGRQMLVWSKGLKKRHGVGEVSDQEITDQDLGDKIAFCLASWPAPSLGAPILNILQQRGVAAARAFCEANGLDVRDADDPDVSADREALRKGITAEMLHRSNSDHPDYVSSLRGAPTAIPWQPNPAPSLEVLRENLEIADAAEGAAWAAIEEVRLRWAERAQNVEGVDPAEVLPGGENHLEHHVGYNLHGFGCQHCYGGRYTRAYTMEMADEARSESHRLLHTYDRAKARKRAAEKELMLQERTA